MEDFNSDPLKTYYHDFLNYIKQCSSCLDISLPTEPKENKEEIANQPNLDLNNESKIKSFIDKLKSYCTSEEFNQRQIKLLNDLFKHINNFEFKYIIGIEPCKQWDEDL